MRNDSGLYQLVISLPKSQNIQIGKLGVFSFPEGYYVYTGSAKKGLNKRIERHLRKRKKLHWHIDYLLRFGGSIVRVNRYEEAHISECELNERTKNKPYGKILALGFGSSDCSCSSHLTYFATERFHSLDFL